MSYRAFKRLLGETSLERKCRFLFGAFILLLIAASFLLYARQTESRAYEQMNTMSRLLVHPIVVRQHVKDLDAKNAGDEEYRNRMLAMDEFRDKWEGENLSPIMGTYTSVFLKPGVSTVESREDSYGMEKLKEFIADDALNESSRRSEKENRYYRAIRATRSCLPCHHKHADNSEVKEGDVIAALRITQETDEIERGVHASRAILITTAFITALLAMRVRSA